MIIGAARVLALALAAGAVASAAACGSSGGPAPTSRPAGPTTTGTGVPTTQVGCVASGASSSELTAARSVLAHRLLVLTGHAATVRITDQRISAVLPAAAEVSAADRAALCAPGEVTIRPVLAAAPVRCGATAGATRATAPSATATSAGGAASSAGSPTSSAGSPTPSATATEPCTTAPLADLTRSNPGIARATPDTITAALHDQVTSALARTDCTVPPPQPDVPAVVSCDTTEGAPIALLLGAPVVTPAGIDTASVQTVQGATTVEVQLTAIGQDAFGSWTSKYNTGGDQTSPSLADCGPQAIPCPDFLAQLVDGQVISTPFSEAALTAGTFQVSGGSLTSSAAAAHLTALRLGGRELPVPMSPSR